MLALIVNLALAVALLGSPVAPMAPAAAPAAVAATPAANQNNDAGKVIIDLLQDFLDIIRNIFAVAAVIAILLACASFMLQGAPLVGDFLGNNRGAFMRAIFACIGAGMATQFVNWGIGFGGEIDQLDVPKANLLIALPLMLELLGARRLLGGGLTVVAPADEPRADGEAA